MGKVLDEWIADSQEFLHTKLPASDRHCDYRLCAQPLAARHHLPHHARGRAERCRPGAPCRGQDHVRSHPRHGLAIIGLIAGLQFLDAMGFNLAPLLASAGVAGIAIGLAAQNIVKDMFNGFLILVEGQFSVGDTVRLAGVSGIVETLTLRKTTVRDADGTLYVIPNSQITTVANLSAGYSVATVNVSVDFSANPDEVTKLLTRIAMDIRNSEQYKNVFFAPTRKSSASMLSKVRRSSFRWSSKPAPRSNTTPMREFQRRVRLALLEERLTAARRPHSRVHAIRAPRGQPIGPQSGAGRGRVGAGPNHTQARGWQPIQRLTKYAERDPPI